MCQSVDRAGPEADFALPRPPARSCLRASAGISLPRLTDAQRADRRAATTSVGEEQGRERPRRDSRLSPTAGADRVAGRRSSGNSLWGAMSPIAGIRFLTVDGRRLAYEVAGEGSLVLCPGWWVSHLELDRGNEGFSRFWEAIGDGYSVVRYDRLGVGVSERALREQDLSVDGEVSLIGALLDELGAERISLLEARRVDVRRSRSRRVFPSGSSGWCSTVPTRMGPRSRRRRRARRSWLRCVRIGALGRGCCRTSFSVRRAVRSRNRSRGFSGWRLVPIRRRPCSSRCIATTFATSCHS